MMTTERNQLVGGHVTPEIKEKLKQEARKNNISVSMLIYRLLAQRFGGDEGTPA